VICLFVVLAASGRMTLTGSSLADNEKPKMGTISLDLGHFPYQFLPARRYASAGYRDRNVSVRLSRAGIVSKRRKLAA